MMNWKGCGRKRSWPNFKVLSRQLPRGAEENHGNLVRIASVRDSDPGPPKHMC
jgi:hypothetical protein